MDESINLVGQTEYANHTTIHPLGFIAVLIMGISVLFLPRRWVIMPFMIIACFIPSAQRIVIMDFDFDYLRIITLFGVMRLLMRREYQALSWTPLDTMIMIWGVCSMVFYIFRLGTVTAFVNRLGFAYDALGMYLIFRCLIGSWEDIQSLIMGVAMMSIPIAILFILENQSGRNIFSVFGGVPEITDIREGKLRCQGAFSHPILAGCFWAGISPWIFSMWWKSVTGRVWAVVGISATCIIVICCASSTPIMGLFSAVIGGVFFVFRRQMRIIRWGLLFGVIFLHIVMRAPVWHLVSRASAVGGSTGWHRFNLIDQAIKHFNEWWLCGCSGMTVASWGVYSSDVTNQYIAEGINGGFLSVCLFIAVIAVAFRQVGIVWRMQSCNRFRVAIAWSLGVSILVHCMNYIGVTYFGQMNMLWYLLLAMIGSASTFKAAKPQVLFRGRRTRDAQGALLLSPSFQ